MSKHWDGFLSYCRSAIIMFIIGLLLLYFDQGQCYRYHTTKEAELLLHWELLIAYHFLFLSSTATRSSTLTRGIAGLGAADVCWSGSHVNCAKVRHCEDPGLMIITCWDTCITANKHLCIPKSNTTRIGWITVPLVNVHHRIVQNNFWRHRFDVLSCC